MTEKDQSLSSLKWAWTVLPVGLSWYRMYCLRWACWLQWMYFTKLFGVLRKINSILQKCSPAAQNPSILRQYFACGSQSVVFQEKTSPLAQIQKYFTKKLRLQHRIITCKFKKNVRLQRKIRCILRKKCLRRSIKTCIYEKFSPAAQN